MEGASKYRCLLQVCFLLVRFFFFKVPPNPISVSPRTSPNIGFRFLHFHRAENAILESEKRHVAFPPHAIYIPAIASLAPEVAHPEPILPRLLSEAGCMPHHLIEPRHRDKVRVPVTPEQSTHRHIPAPSPTNVVERAGIVK